jgi:hypothetical protein
MKIFILLFIGLVLSISMIGCSNPSTSPQTEAQQGTIVSLSLVPYDLEDLVRDSECILIGKVVKILPAHQNDIGMTEEQVKRGMDLPFRVYTDVLVQAQTIYYGTIQENEIIGVRLWGGLNTIVEGEASFAMGDKSLLFLNSPDQVTPIPEGIKSSSYFSITGLMQGKYEYKEDLFTNPKTRNTITLSELEAKISSLKN